LDKDVIGLISKTEAMVGPGFEERFPHGRPGAVDVYLSDGSRYEAVEETASGDPDRPLDETVLHEKFLSLATPKLGRDRAWRIVEIVDSLENLPNLEPLINELSGPW
jgi:2-methylcitrate dehydratase PrpD